MEIGRLPFPAAGARDVLVVPEAAALNFPDLLIVQGRYQHKPPLPFFVGRDIVGRIHSVGAEVTEFEPGQRVAAQPIFGGFAEVAVVPVSQCFAIPEDLDAKRAASLGTAFATVVAALGIRGEAKANEIVLITGAAGGVGAAGVQYARHLGATVVALVSSAAKEESAKRYGADVVVRSDRLDNVAVQLRDTLRGAGVDGVDVVMDVVGGDTFDGAIRCLRPGGRLVVVGFASGAISSVEANYLLLKDIAVVGSSIQRFLTQRDERLVRVMQEIYVGAASGKFRLDIDSVFPFSSFAEAADRLATREAIGKVVLVPDWKTLQCPEGK
ncbi:hypothetical protein AC630_12210 [Bradyrhizobium sp. AS23.2]|nr:hypothetical protein AC630_12210 [Bradyrhizobium sp. AS23.2]